MLWLRGRVVVVVVVVVEVPVELPHLAALLALLRLEAEEGLEGGEGRLGPELIAPGFPHHLIVCRWPEFKVDIKREMAKAVMLHN